jgi:hypothetical protein
MRLPDPQYGLFIRPLGIVGIIVAACLSVGQPAPAPVPPPVPAASPVVPFRTRLTIGDPDRDWSYISDFDGSLDAVWTIGGVNTSAYALPAVDCFYDAQYHGGFTLPAIAKPGPLVINTGAAAGPATFTVVAMPARRTVSIPPGTTGIIAQKLINAASGFGGPVSVTLPPGPLVWEQTVTLPAGSYVSGIGTTLRRLAMNPIGTNYPTFQVGQDCSFYGIHFEHDAASGMAFWANPTTSGLVASDCIFGGNSNLGFYHSGALIQRCTFNGSGAVIAPSGLFWRCVFNGPSVCDPLQIWYGPTQVVDCEFNGTQRGPVFNAAGGAITDCFFSGTICRNIVRGNNGNECWLCEGGPLNRLLAFHCRISNCDSTAFWFDKGSAGAYIRDFSMDGGCGVMLGPIAPSTITGFTMQDFELRRCGVWCDVGVTGANFIDGSIIGFLPTRANQSFQNTGSTGYLRTVAAYSASPLNLLTRVAIIGTPAGMTPSQGFAVQ